MTVKIAIVVWCKHKYIRYGLQYDRKIKRPTVTTNEFCLRHKYFSNSRCDFQILVQPHLYCSRNFQILQGELRPQQSAPGRLRLQLRAYLLLCHNEGGLQRFRTVFENCSECTLGVFHVFGQCPAVCDTFCQCCDL